jgi:hypothetical protein
MESLTTFHIGIFSSFLLEKLTMYGSFNDVPIWLYVESLTFSITKLLLKLIQRFSDFLDDKSLNSIILFCSVKLSDSVCDYLNCFSV